MEFMGSVNSGTLEIEVDIDDIKSGLEIMDREDVEGVVRDYLDNMDWADHIDVADKVESLLDEYDGNTSPCSVGQSFEKAVSWAMGRKEGSDDEHAARAIRGDENEIRRIVREELLAVMNKGLDRNV